MILDHDFVSKEMESEAKKRLSCVRNVTLCLCEIQVTSYAQVTESTSDGVSTLALKPLGGVNRSPKQRVPVAPQNSDIVTTKLKNIGVVFRFT